jgi:hypothetical protein
MVYIEASQFAAEKRRLGSGVDLKRAHNPKVAGSNPAPATKNDEGLADATAANPFRLPRLHPGLVRLRDSKLQHVSRLQRSARFIRPRPSQAIIT